MRLIVLIAMIAAIFGLRALSSAHLDDQARLTGPETWGIIEDRQSGPILFYRMPNGTRVAQVDCVGTSAAMALLDTARPFNLRLSLHTDLARAWTEGREVVVMMEDLEGWRQVDVIALLDDLIIGPEETETGLVTLSETGQLRFKIMANLSGRGITEQDIALTATGFTDHARTQVSGCSRFFR